MWRYDVNFKIIETKLTSLSRMNQNVQIVYSLFTANSVVKTPFSCEINYTIYNRLIITKRRILLI